MLWSNPDQRTICKNERNSCQQTADVDEPLTMSKCGRQGCAVSLSSCILQKGSTSLNAFCTASTVRYRFGWRGPSEKAMKLSN